MKFILIAMVTVYSTSLWAAKSSKDFNQALLEDLKNDTQINSENFRQGPSRGPASVTEPSEKEQMIQEQKGLQPLEKQYRQLGGRPSW